MKIFVVSGVLFFLCVGTIIFIGKQKDGDVDKRNDFALKKSVYKNNEKPKETKNSFVGTRLAPKLLEAGDLTSNAVLLSANEADFKLRCVFTGNIHGAYYSEIGRKTDLELEVLLKSKKGKEFESRLQVDRKKYLSSNYCLELFPKGHFDFKGFSISEYDLKTELFLIILENKSYYKKIKHNKNYVKAINNIIFKALPSYSERDNNIRDYYYLTLGIKVPKKKALKIEQNRKRVTAKIFFRLSGDTESGGYYSTIRGGAYKYELPIVNAALFRLSLDGETLFEKLYQ